MNNNYEMENTTKNLNKEISELNEKLKPYDEWEKASIHTYEISNDNVNSYRG